MTAIVLRGDARNLPLPDASVDLIVTSPPYFGLRSYTDAGEHYAGQIGSESTPAKYVAALLECTREWMRVLKPSGSMWVNLGDKYSSAPSGYVRHPGALTYTGGGRRPYGIQPKSLLGLPWRYALGCIDQLGLILRAEVIWAKPNGLPESVTDRVRRSHEQWFHFVRQPRYFAAVDTIREPGVGCHPRGPDARKNPNRRDGWADILAGHPLGSLPGSVWTVATEPLTVPDHLVVDHFAAFPSEWPRRIIQGWSPSGICTACGEGRRPVAHNDPIPGWVRGTPATRTQGGSGSGHDRVGARVTVGSRITITGEACACPDTTAPTRPALVVDPFGGTGTTSLVADVLGRIGVSVDASYDYCRLARWRTTDPGQRAHAMRVDKPPTPLDGQLGLDLEGIA